MAELKKALLVKTPDQVGMLEKVSNAIAGKGVNILAIAAYVEQDGKAVFKRAVKDMADVSIQIMEKNNLTGKDIRFLIPHQANLRIIDAVAKKMGLGEDHVVVNIGKYGNTTAATIPLAMSEAYRDRLIKKRDWIVISAFGAGYTWGSCLIRWAMD